MGFGKLMPESQEQELNVERGMDTSTDVMLCPAPVVLSTLCREAASGLWK